jgi:hypothetical protein
MKNEIVRHKLELVAATGKRTALEIAVGTPYSCPDEMDKSITCWYGPVEIKGIRDKVHAIGGDDPFESLVLSIMFVKRMLLSAKQNGNRIVFVGTDEDYPIEEIFEMGDCQQNVGT